MADKDGKITKRVTDKQLDSLEDFQDAEILRDQKGSSWIVSEQHAHNLKESSKGHKLQVMSAKSLIDRQFRGVGLTAQQRKIILLSTEGLNQSDIAKFLKLHKSTVREHLEAAKKKLKKLIPEFGGED